MARLVDMVEFGAILILLLLAGMLAVLRYTNPPKGFRQACREIVEVSGGLLGGAPVLAVWMLVWFGLWVGVEFLFATFAWSVYEFVLIVGFVGWVVWSDFRRFGNRKPRVK